MSWTLALKLYGLTVPVFFLIDIIWLTAARNFYRKHLGPLMAERVNWPAAAVFYLLFLAGLLVFVVIPSVRSGQPGRSLFLGALFGLVTYATYDLTNLATLKGWPPIITWVDLVWGSVLCALVARISCALYFLVLD